MKIKLFTFQLIQVLIDKVKLLKLMLRTLYTIIEILSFFLKANIFFLLFIDI